MVDFQGLADLASAGGPLDTQALLSRLDATLHESPSKLMELAT